jgi:S1-C subfamily serine protease
VDGGGGDPRLGDDLCAAGPDAWPPAAAGEHWPPSAGAAPAGGPGCFGPAEPALAAALPAILHVVVAPAEGQVVARGTGFIVRDSAAGPDAPHRILTAAHVVGPALDRPDRLGVHLVAADGRVLGRAVVRATGSPWQGARRAESGARPDLAVLEPIFANAAAEAAYRAIPGLPLFPTQPEGVVFRGRISQPAGIDFGISGAPALDASGQVRGVVTRMQSPDRGGRVYPAALDIAAPGAAGAPAGGAGLPQASTGIAEPVTAAPILAALGPAGRPLGPGRGTAAEERFAAILPGYPQRLCLVFRGAMEAAPPPLDEAARERLRQALRMQQG